MPDECSSERWEITTLNSETKDHVVDSGDPGLSAVREHLSRARDGGQGAVEGHDGPDVEGGPRRRVRSRANLQRADGCSWQDERWTIVKGIFCGLVKKIQKETNMKAMFVHNKPLKSEMGMHENILKF